MSKCIDFDPIFFTKLKVIANKYLYLHLEAHAVRSVCEWRGWEGADFVVCVYSVFESVI